MAETGTGAQISKTKVRAGLALIGVVLVAALATMVAVDSPAGKALMFAIMATVLVRGVMLVRSLRRDAEAEATA
jgi:hypothetical protein